MQAMISTRIERSIKTEKGRCPLILYTAESLLAVNVMAPEEIAVRDIVDLEGLPENRGRVGRECSVPRLGYGQLWWLMLPKSQSIDSSG